MFSRAFSRISGVLLAILAVMLVTACGGGSGGSASNPPSLSLSETKMAFGSFSGTIYGGSPPFYLETNTSAIELDLPRDSTYNNAYVSSSRNFTGYAYPVSEDGTGQVHVWDKVSTHANGGSASFVYVGISFDPSTLTVTATGNAGCTTNDDSSLCANSQGIATLQLTGIGVANQPVQFSVVSGHFKILYPNSGTWETTVSTMTDSAGMAQVVIKADANVSTEVAQIRARFPGSPLDTLVTSFTIVGNDFMILPGDITLTSPTATCPARSYPFKIYGGTPPYDVIASPGSVSPSVVTAIGGSVTLTLSDCGDGTLTAHDAQGRLATASFSYKAADQGGTPPTEPVTTSKLGNWGGTSVATPPVSCAVGTVFSFSVQGGTAPYVWLASPAIPGLAGPQSITPPVGTIEFTAATGAGHGSYVITVMDSKAMQSTTPMTLYCTP
ncbi:MAG: hypothetical protein LBB65_01195 [Burkholderiales bacterium]|nr:hypothetical protein [Burkholderiales bacterium]